MSTQRYIDVSFYDDAWVQELDPSEKFMYMYLLTNPLTNIAGIYKITPKRMSFDTGFNIDTVKHIINKFSTAGKVFQKGEYIILKNWCKHQKIEGGTNGKASNVKIGIDRILLDLEDDVLLFLKEINFAYNFLDDVLKQRGLEGASRNSNYLNLNLDLDLNLNSNSTTNSPFPDSTASSSSYDEKEAELLRIIEERDAEVKELKEKVEKLSAPKKRAKSSTSKNSEPQLLDDEFYKTLVKHYNSVYKSVFPNGFPNSKGYRPQVDRAYTKLQELGHSDETCKELLLKAITNAPRITFWRTSGDNGANGALAFILSETGLGKTLSLDNEPQVAIKKGQSAFDDNKKREYNEEGKW